MSGIINTAGLSFPFATDSPFLFAVYHLDKYPAGNDRMAVDASLLRGHNIGADFGNPAGWSMYHGEDGIPGFPKHPHRGFETITVTRRGIIDHTDSLGNGGRFGYGDVQWMTAGEGISHAEMFPLLNQSGVNELELFQIWINLPRASKMAKPSFKMLWAEELPTQCDSGAEVVLVAGTLPGFNKPPDPPPDSYAAAKHEADVLVVTVKLEAGGKWTLPKHSGSPQGMNRNFYFHSGSALLINGKKLTNHAKVKVEPGMAFELAAEATGPAEVLILQGRDIGEPVVQHGPFVGNTQNDIMQAFRDYQSTGFGAWPWESSSLAFPRERSRFAKYADGTLIERPMPATSATTSSPGVVGTTIRIQGLQSKPELNGAAALVLAKDDASGRFAVRITTLPDGSTPKDGAIEIKVKPDCIA